ncbi:unnamed protein product (macronuclear) [Paramecium tetraurelia]|uniref:FHA domain-containing protein n=1 Tax=Paramecium tetraurelia TaxID=5888 RepID=A0BLV6_PARTE|nr:uncharacterized protein GSPATT00030157001 [Paramecium tetraurelia]CAK59523.1 unnamed protein product [Paramecium tetraurelia]|eukprot:XP_001426921.1 hypothetical protein (macronuclear) [Paramecium tetraurelia strain d4-2]
MNHNVFYYFLQKRLRRITIRVENEDRSRFNKVIPIDGQKYKIGNSGGNENYVFIPFGVSSSGDQFELDSSLLLIPVNNSEFQNQYNQVLRSYDVPQNIISRIGEFAIVPKQKLKLKDISGRRGYPSLINISRQCENQELIKNKVFIIGKTSKLTVKQNNQLFGDFLDSPRLFEITNNKKVVGLGSGMDALFKQSFERKITEKEFYQTLNSVQLKKEFDEFYSKSCIIIRISENNLDQSYLLVEKSKRTPSPESLNRAQLFNRRRQSLPVYLSRNALSINKSKRSICFFSIGRVQTSDIVLNDKSVSSYHGMIGYHHKTKKWIIFDGQYENARQRNWKNSSNGIWLAMEQNKNYYLDKEQIIKINDFLISMYWN